MATTSAAAADGYRTFIEDHLDEAYRLATFVIGARADAEDAVHEAAISAWRHWPDRRDDARTEAWFRRIVVNACRDRLRAQRRIRALPIGLEIDAAHHPLEPDVAAGVAQRDRFAEILARLDVDDRVLLTLRFGLDLTVPAVAGVLGIRDGTVKSRLHRALAAVRVGLGGER